MIKILIADEHIIIRGMLRQILRDSDDMEVVDEVGKVEEMLKQLYQCDFDLLLLDISMARQNLSDVVKEVKAARPELSILVLSTYHEAQYEKHVLRSGASGYLAKSEGPDRLKGMIRAIAKGDRQGECSPSVK